MPALPGEAGLRLKLASEHLRRFRTGYRPVYAPLHKPPSFMSPRLVAAGEREVTDYRHATAYLNSLHHWPGQIFLRDGRLNAHKFPGPVAYDRLYRLMSARGIRAVGLAKTARLLVLLQRDARAIRQHVGDRPLVIPILRSHLSQAHPGHSSAFLKTLRHGDSAQAYGGAGAVRFALSITGDTLYLVEFNLYDLNCFRPLVFSGMTLTEWVRQTFGHNKRTVYSWDILQFVTVEDWEQLLIPVLEAIVYSAFANDEHGIYPRVLAEVHNRVKLRSSEIEELRRQILAELSRYNLAPEQVPAHYPDPHQFDPDVVNLSSGGFW
ncbi:MAG: hypothetical protein D6706_04590 [Chloroflexi bacterium]|nr:MAG: hypothetical protein D6706_04590 [Chloroflexota bacterium]